MLEHIVFFLSWLLLLSCYSSFPGELILNHQDSTPVTLPWRFADIPCWRIQVLDIMLLLYISFFPVHLSVACAMAKVVLNKTHVEIWLLCASVGAGALHMSLAYFARNTFSWELWTWAIAVRAKARPPSWLVTVTCPCSSALLPCSHTGTHQTQLLSCRLPASGTVSQKTSFFMTYHVSGILL